jgi:uncharacterized protein YjeT (DUF2065 family)
MDSLFDYLLIGFALMLVIEGVIYALFPIAVRRMMAMAIMMHPQKLRIYGLSIAAIGTFMTWILIS